jgi:hypothetical protein
MENNNLLHDLWYSSKTSLFNINIGFKNQKDINKETTTDGYFYFCRELLITDHHYDDDDESFFYLYPTYNLNFSFPINDFNKFNNDFYSINYKKFHNKIMNECFFPNLNMIDNFNFIKPIEAPKEGRNQNIYIDLGYNTESINQGYILKPYNVPVDSWNLLVIRSYMLAAFYTEVSEKQQEEFLHNEFKYMSEKFDYYNESYAAINEYKEKIYGNEDKYKYINNYSGILDFMNRV